MSKMTVTEIVLLALSVFFSAAKAAFDFLCGISKPSAEPVDDCGY